MERKHRCIVHFGDPCVVATYYFYLTKVNKFVFEK